MAPPPYALSNDMAFLHGFAWVAFTRKFVREHFMRLGEPFIVGDATIVGKKTLNYSLFWRLQTQAIVEFLMGVPEARPLEVIKIHDITLQRMKELSIDGPWRALF